ncbi:MAG: hypothetical protein ACREX4_21490, partial [Gammaproteobacteria bacterium]
MKANGTPLFPEVGLLALPYHRFDWPWMTPHHVLTRLANYFRVLWLEPAHHWRDAASCKTRQNDIARLTHTLPSSFNIYVPEPWLPKMYRPTFARQALAQARVRRAWRQLREQGCEQLVLHLWHHQFEAALNVGAHQVSLYHIDDEYSFLPEPGPMEARESRVIHAVDRVFAISPGLMERKGGINPRMTFAPEGVDYRLYSTPVPEPADIAHIPHPRVGYTGILKPSLNWRLLANLARRHPHWSFVFVGARNMDKNGNDLLDELAGLKNVYLLG